MYVYERCKRHWDHHSPETSSLQNCLNKYLYFQNVIQGTYLLTYLLFLNFRKTVVWSSPPCPHPEGQTVGLLVSECWSGSRSLWAENGFVSHSFIHFLRFQPPERRHWSLHQQNDVFSSPLSPSERRRASEPGVHQLVKQKAQWKQTKWSMQHDREHNEDGLALFGCEGGNYRRKRRVEEEWKCRIRGRRRE